MSALTTLIKEASNCYSLKPADCFAVADAEAELGLQFASDYEEYLLAFGAATFDGRELTGVCDSERLSVVQSTERARRLYPLLPKDAYVVEDLSFDHVYVVQDSSGKVYSYGPSDSRKLIASSLLEYLFPNSG